MMHIIGSEFNVEHGAYEIYISGCKRDCPGCHNPEAQGYGKGLTWERWLRINIFRIKSNPLVKEVWVLGGDLLCQLPEDAVEFSTSLKNKLKGTDIPIMLWTGEEDLENIPREILRNFNYVKLGSYKQELDNVTVEYGGKEITLASSNQRIVTL